MTADTVGGVWTYALELADALAPHDVEVHLATMGRRLDAAQRDQADRSAVAALHEAELALEWEDDPWDDVERAGAWLLDLEREVAPDLVHLNGYGHGSLPWHAGVVVVAHSDVLSWWRAVKHAAAPSSWERYRLAVQAGLAAADAVVAPTRAVLDDLSRHYTFATRTYVVHNGRTWPDAPREKEPFVLGLGRFWDEAKNVAALERLRDASPWPVVVAGSGTARGALAPSEVAELLSRASVFASPARYEPFGLAILEAAHASCALVLGDIPSLRELWDGAALFVGPDDDDALAAALQLLARDDPLRRRLAGKARKRARLYSPEAMADGYVEVYRRVLAPAREAVNA